MLNRILVFKDLGFSLPAIRRLVDQETSLGKQKEEPEWKRRNNPLPF